MGAYGTFVRHTRCITHQSTKRDLLHADMDIYKRKSTWKWILALAALVIVCISLAYTTYLARELAAEEKKKAAQYGSAVLAVTNSDLDSNSADNCDLTFHWDIMRQNTTIPVFLLDESGAILDYRNIGEDSSGFMEPALVQSTYQKMVDAGDTSRVSIRNRHFENTLVYSHSRLLELLKLYPILQFILISVFILFGYLGFSASRRAEENQVWVGMAKETAHQLGTPITAIVGWIEHLRLQNENQPENLLMIEELRNDVLKLELIADRFSKIGSTPELQSTNIYDQLESVRAYMKLRSPKRIVFNFPDPATHEPIPVMINQHLFDWVLENLLRNAIDAMENGEGTITCEVRNAPTKVTIALTDTGKGIPHKKFKTVFKPGYTTKTRGWGLGLSLSKRIIEKYHGGKIYVSNSEPNVATTFVIELEKGKK